MSVSVKFIISSIFFFLACSLVCPAMAFAGELGVSSPNVRERRVRHSSSDVQRKSKIGFRRGNVVGRNNFLFSRSEYSKELERYKDDLGRWERKTARLQYRAARKARKEKLKEERRARKEKLRAIKRAQKEQRRLIREQQKLEKQKLEKAKLEGGQAPKEGGQGAAEQAVESEVVALPQVPSPVLGRRYSPGAALDYSELPQDPRLIEPEDVYNQQDLSYPQVVEPERKGFWQQLVELFS